MLVVIGVIAGIVSVETRMDAVHGAPLGAVSDLLPPVHKVKRWLISLASLSLFGCAQMELKEDFALISDLVQLIVAAALGGLLFGLLRLPVILGYLVAGSVVGPGGMGLIDELVQVRAPPSPALAGSRGS